MAEKRLKEIPKGKIKKTEKKGAGQTNSLWPALVIFLLAFILYGNTIKHDYALDDDIFTRKNTFVQKGFSALPEIFSKSSMFGFNRQNDANYRPMVLLNFMFEKSMWGNNPHVNHFFNVFLFALTCVFLFLLLRKLLQSFHIAFPFLVTLLFLFHPVHTEVVANIKSRDEILGLLFGILSFIFAVKSIDRKRISYLILSLIMFFCASLSKESALVFALIAPLIIFFFRNESNRKIVMTAIPFLALAGVYWMIRAYVTGGGVQAEKIAPINNTLMAATNVADMYATNFMMLGKYIQLLFFPHPLSWDYSYRQFPIVSWANVWAIISLLAYLGMGAYILFRIKQKDVFAFAMLFYLITIFPTSNLVIKFGATFAERFLYSPSLGFCIAIPFLFSKAFRITDLKSSPNSKVVYLCMGVILLLFGIKTFSQNEVWTNNFTLFTAGVNTSPNSSRAHSSLGSEYRDRGEGSQNPSERQKYFSSAVSEYLKSIEILPTSDTYYNLGVVYYNMGDHKNAKVVYEKSIKMNPRYAPAYNNLGAICIANKDYEKAEMNFQKAIKLDPAYADSYANLGVIYHNKGELQKAIPMYEKSIECNPRNINVYDNLAKLYRNLGDSAKSTYYANRVNMIR